MFKAHSKSTTEYNICNLQFKTLTSIFAIRYIRTCTSVTKANPYGHTVNVKINSKRKLVVK